MKLSISAVAYNTTPELERYARIKLGRLAKLAPRKIWAGTICQVAFSQRVHANIKFCTCNVTMEVNGVELQARETTQHMYAALDIAIVHIEHQLVDSMTRAKKRRLHHFIHKSLHDDWTI